MNMQLFFDSLHDELLQTWAQPESIYELVEFHAEDRVPSWKDADIAIFSVDEFRGNLANQPQTPNGQHQIRKSLYALKPFARNCKIVDLGVLRLGQYLEETHLRIAEVCEHLLNHNTLPIIVGGSHDLDYGQFMGYQNMEKLLTVLQIDARIDLQSGKPDPALASQQHLHQILTHHPNYLFDCVHLGSQRYLNPKKVLDTMHALLFEIKSVGDVRESMKEAEPLARMADMLSFDLSAIKRADAVACHQNSPFGFTGEEACQLCWYAGTNEKLSSFGMYEYNADLDPNGHTAEVVAIMLWYFIEGFCHRQEEYSFNTNFHTKYLVPIASQTLVFFKSKVSEKWWMEIQPLTGKNKVYKRPLLLPCSYTDYETATQGELPEKWIKAQGKVG